MQNVDSNTIVNWSMLRLSTLLANGHIPEPLTISMSTPPPPLLPDQHPILEWRSLGVITGGYLFAHEISVLIFLQTTRICWYVTSTNTNQ